VTNFAQKHQMDNRNQVPIYAQHHQMYPTTPMCQAIPSIIYTRELPENRWSKELFDFSHDIPFCAANFLQVLLMG